jgi:tRNA 2-thiouridine synthesizing protein A
MVTERAKLTFCETTKIKGRMMSEEIKADKIMDLKGLPCPMPIVKVSKGIKEVEVGQIVEAISTDPGSLTDFPAWARTSGNEIVKTEQDGNVITFFIKRVA